MKNQVQEIKMANYFNTLSLREKLAQLGKCRFMQREEFSDGCNFIKDWNGKFVVLIPEVKNLK